MGEDFEAWLREASESVREAVEHRDELIFDASEAGLSRRMVAEAVGLSPTRVQQIVDAEKEKRHEPGRRRKR